MNPVKHSPRAPLLFLLVTASLFWMVVRAPLALAQQSYPCTNAAVSADPSPTVCLSQVVVVFNGASPDNQFYVSWRSQKTESGRVQLTDGEIFEDVRGADYQGKTHYVLVNNVAPKTTYTFDVVSGGTTFTNGGAHWSQRTGPALASGTPYTIIGRVKNPDGSDADGALVYAQVRDADGQGTPGRSALLSSVIVLADGGNFFNINLEPARTANLGQKFSFDPAADRVQITAVGAQGTATKTFTIGDLSPPQPPPSLILGESGTGSAATATPTLLAPTSTPTLSPTATATATSTEPAATATLLPLPPTRPPQPTETEAVVNTIETREPTVDTPQETRVAENAVQTSAANSAGQEVELQSTRVARGVPTLQPALPSANNTLLSVAIAIVFFVGALLLGLAAYFVSRH